MTKRNLFAELTEGFDALAAARKGKKTLRSTEVELKPAVQVSVPQIMAHPHHQARMATTCPIERWRSGTAAFNETIPLDLQI